MSEATIRKKLTRAYAQAGKILGKQFDVYRPVDMSDCLAPQNLLLKQTASFTLSRQYSHDQAETFKMYITYTDSSKCDEGDIFSDGTDTYVIVWNKGIEDVMAIRCSDLVEIHRPSWSTTDGLQPVRVRIGKNVPASITGMSSVSDISLGTVANTAQADRWEVRIWANTPIQQTDNIIRANGSILHVDTIETHQLYQVLTCSLV
jgi:hypothetical protein